MILIVIIESLTSKYTECEEGSDLLEKTLEHLRENIKAGICLICIEDVGRNEAVSKKDSFLLKFCSEL